MQLLREAPSLEYEKWLELHAGEAVSGVYALFESDDCVFVGMGNDCLLYTSPSPRDMRRSRMPSSA